MSTKHKVKIDVVSDVVCPWCYVGKRRLEKAMNSFAETIDFNLEYHPFELNPTLPLAGAHQRDYLTEKFGGDEHYEAATHRVTRLAAREGLTFNFNKQLVSPNTRKLHALILAANQENVQSRVVESFFKAYFTDGIDLSQEENIRQLAVLAGMSQQTIDSAWTHLWLETVVSREDKIRKMGIKAVPYYIIGNQFGISGAQPEDQFINIIKMAGASTTGQGEFCATQSKC